MLLAICWYLCPQALFANPGRLLFQSHLSQWSCTCNQVNFSLMHFWNTFQSTRKHSPPGTAYCLRGKHCSFAWMSSVTANSDQVLDTAIVKYFWVLFKTSSTAEQSAWTFKKQLMHPRQNKLSLCTEPVRCSSLQILLAHTETGALYTVPDFQLLLNVNLSAHDNPKDFQSDQLSWYFRQAKYSRDVFWKHRTDNLPSIWHRQHSLNEIVWRKQLYQIRNKTNKKKSK